MGDVNHSRRDGMLVGLVGIIVVYVSSHIRRAYLAVVLWQGEHLVSRSLYRARLVHVDVCRLCGKHALVAGKDGVDDCGVCLCASHKEMNPSVLQRAGVENEPLRTTAVLVESVARSLLEVCLRKAAHQLRMGAFHVITVKM